jgi:hypothetical protein
MKPLKDTFYDEKEDGYTPIIPGLYPAHVTSLDSRSFDSGSMVFNVTFQIAEEAKDMQISKQSKNGNDEWNIDKDKDGKDIKISAGYLSGKKFRSTGVWLTPSPGKGQGWKNRNYVKFFEPLGVIFPEADGKTKIMEVEESDILGIPSIVKIGEEEYTQDGAKKMAIRIFSTLPWASGTKLDASEIEEEVPF